MTTHAAPRGQFPKEGSQPWVVTALPQDRSVPGRATQTTMPADPQPEPSQTGPPCPGSCAEPSCHLLCTVGPGNKVTWDRGRGPGVPPASEQLQHGHPHPHEDREGGRNLGSQQGVKGAVKWSRKWRCASGLSCSGPSPAASPQPIARLQPRSTKPCCHPVALEGLGMAWVVGLHHPQHPSSLAGAKTSLPGPISFQLKEELPTSSSLTPFILNLVVSRQPHASAQTALAAAFLDPSAGDEHILGGIPAHPVPLMAETVQNCQPGQRGPCPKHLYLTACGVMPCTAGTVAPLSHRPDLPGHFQGASPAQSLQPSKPGGSLLGNSSALDIHQGCVKIAVNSLLCPRT